MKPMPAQTASRFNWIIPAIALAGFVVRVAGLDAQSLFNEEGYSLWLSQLGPARVLAQTASLDSNTPLHYLLLGGWVSLAGASEFSARLLSVFAGVLTIAVAAALAREVAAGAPAAAAWSAALVAALPVGIDVSQEARMYALLMLFTALSAWGVARSLSRNRWRDWGIWGCFAVAGFATHVLGALVVMAQAGVAGLFWLARGRRNSRPLIAIGITGAVIAIWIVVIASVSAPTMTTYAGRLDYFALLPQALAANLMPRLRAACAISAAALVCVLLLIVVGWQAAPAARRLVMMTGLYLLAAAALGAWTGKYGWLYASATAPMLAALAGAVLARAQTWSVVFKATPGLILLLVAGLSWASWRADPVNANEDFRGAARYVREHLAADEVTLIVPDYSWTFEYYFGPGRWFAIPEMPMLNVAEALDYESAMPAVNRALAGAQGAWVLFYDETLLDPSRLIQSLLRRQAQAFGPALDTADFHGLRLMHFRFFRPYEPLPERLPRMSSRLEPIGAQRGLTGLGCHQFELPHAGDAWMEVACFWRLAPGADLPWDTQVSLRLIDAAGAQVLQSDQMLAPYGLPYLAFDKPITAFYVLGSTDALASGDYTLAAIPYTPEGQIAPQVMTPIRIEARRSANAAP